MIFMKITKCWQCAVALLVSSQLSAFDTHRQLLSNQMFIYSDFMCTFSFMMYTMCLVT